MVKNVSRVVYKPEHEKNDEFIVMVNLPEYKKWKEGDTSIPLAEVVDSFQILHTTQGSQGILGKPSIQLLDNAFNTHNDDEVITAILQKGKEQSTDGIRTGFGSTNMTRGSAVIDTKGRGNLNGV